MTGPTAERPYLSIGEVLGLLLEEFPDVTISKIRFLESQGLIDPERTPSGYRKFYDGDVDRLRTILREQKENFLPLKVIRDRLERGDIDPEGSQATPPRGIRNVTQLPRSSHVDEAAAAASTPVRHHPSTQLRLAEPAAASAVAASPESEPAANVDGASEPVDDLADQPTIHPPVPTPSTMQDAVTHNTRRDNTSRDITGRDSTGKDGASADNAELMSDAPGVHPRMSAAYDSPKNSQQRPAPDSTDPSRPELSSRGNYSAAELCSYAGISAEQLAEIEAFGLISGRGNGPAASYAGTDLTIAEAAAGFLHRGVEGRHLRAWRQAAERESALFEQLILPHLRQRNPQARRQAAETLNELCRLGGELRSAILASALQQHLDG